MLDARLVQYDEELHRDHIYDLFVEYGTGLNGEVFKHYGVNLFDEKDIDKLTKMTVSKLVPVKPPLGIIYILQVGDEVAGMGRLTRLSDSISEINGVFVRPEYRGKGFSYLFIDGLEAKAREFGYSKVRLDVADFNHVAQHVYRKVGFKEIPRYTDVGAFESEALKSYYENKAYMEKKL